MLKKAAAVLLVCGSIAITVGCSSTSSHFLYAAIPSANQITAFREDPNSGALVQLAGSPITAGGAVQSIAIHPKLNYLYAANSGDVPGDISRFTMSVTGGLQEITPRTAAGTAPFLLAIDSAGNYLYAANSGSLDVSVFSIDSSDGHLTAVGNPFPIGLSPSNMALTPSGNFLYITGPGNPGFIEGFAMANGIATPVPGSPFFTGANPFGLAIDPTGSFLYTGNKLDSSISEFSINSDGSLSQLPGSPIGETYIGPVAVLVDPSGKFLYAANQGSGNMAGFSIGSTGSNAGGLTLLLASPFGTGSQPAFIASDPAGNVLFLANQSSSGTIQSFTVDQSGTLTLVSTYSAGGIPTSIAVTH
jgi:6-phosphogluconolactonase